MKFIQMVNSEKYTGMYDSDKLLVTQITNKKDILKEEKEVLQVIYFYWPEFKNAPFMIKVEGDQRMISVQFDPAIIYLKENHNWDKHPMVALKVIMINGEERVFAKWTKEVGKGSMVFKPGRVQLISMPKNLAEYARRRNRENVKKH